ncbi:TKL family protein kinase [Tritrichomonas foetus]|uniref:TKL family protein kinase n=1 Tax=Tritrichomonas foetus TaxID=1144522 RepID=A0A1J4L4M8_9EUKA|nr:TKL family protein kinase [Tritrichomonas foetus]|eukprot:OHT16932.1 TKL family protein kinase [Tritrichomonas foetus]
MNKLLNGEKQKTQCTSDAIKLIIRLIQNYPNYIRDISDFQFEQQIGKGGFGQVWLARDLRSGKLCAIKELHQENLTPRNMQSFAREVNTMIKIHERFILPIIGYTIDPPYSIISEYMPNGTLTTYTDLRKRKNQLSGTHLSIIALGTAWGMINMHRKHIVHRDLKACNILLDHNFLPVICDFGISRNEPKSGRMSMRLGTVTHMAPEVMISNEYGLSCDVYSFGLLLYEMSQNTRPYRKIPKAEIYDKVINGVRPKFINSSTPKSLMNLIENCWNKDPTKRPDFYDIFESFQDGKVYFKGTDKTMVKNFANDLIIEEKSRTSKKRILPPLTIDIDSILQRLQRQLDIQIDKETQLKHVDQKDTNIDLNTSKEERKIGYVFLDDEGIKPREVLMDTGHPFFARTLKYLTKNITLKQFRKYYSLLFPHFRDLNDEASLSFIMENFCKLIRRNPQFIDLFEKMHFFTALPLLSKETLNMSFEFVAIVFEKRPNLISHSLFRALGSFLMKIPEKVIHLFALYAKKFNEVNDPFHVFDLLISYAQNFIEIPSGSQYIDILFYLITTYNDFRKLRLQKVKPILYVFCRSKTRCVTYSATCALANLYDNTFKSPFNVICRNILDPGLKAPAISILLRTTVLPESRVLCRTLQNALPESASVLLKFSAQSLNMAKMVALNQKWMSCSPSMTLYKLFLYLYTQKEIRGIINKSPLLSSFISEYVCLPDIQVVISILSVVKRMTIDQHFVNELANTNFFRNLCLSLNLFEYDSSLVTAFNSFLDFIARKGYTIEFQIFIPLLMNFLSQKNQHTTEAIAVFATLSCHKPLSTILNDANLINYFKSLQSTSFKKTADVFLNNLEKFTCST